MVAQLRGVEFRMGHKGGWMVLRYWLRDEGKVMQAVCDVAEWLGFESWEISPNPNWYNDCTVYGRTLAKEKERIFERATY